MQISRHEILGIGSELGVCWPDSHFDQKTLSLAPLGRRRLRDHTPQLRNQLVLHHSILHHSIMLGAEQTCPVQTKHRRGGCLRGSPGWAATPQAEQAVCR
jgi:hypothetical protein